VNKMTERSEDELRAAAFKLRTEKRMTHRQIADELGIALGRVGEMLKGVAASGPMEEPSEQKKPPQFIPMLISKEHVAKLYALAMDEGFDDVNEWLKLVLLPWYGVKRDFEWKLRIKIVPHEFAAYVETAMTDSIDLKQLKAKLREMGSPLVASGATAPPVSPAQTVTAPAQVNKGESKA